MIRIDANINGQNTYFIFQEEARHEAICLFEKSLFVHVVIIPILSLIRIQQCFVVTHRNILHTDSPPGWLAPSPGHEASVETLGPAVVRGWVTRSVGTIQFLMSYHFQVKDIISISFPDPREH